MIHALTGTLTGKKANAAIVDCHGVAFFVFVNGRTRAALPPEGSTVTLFTHLYFREDRTELYGFPDEKSLALFELLNSVTGVGPRTALAVLEGETPENLMAAIFEKRTDLLVKTPGIGTRTAERIVLELASKMAVPEATSRTAAMDRDHEVEEALANLGYRRDEVKRALSALGPSKDATPEERVRAALRALARR